MQLLSRIRGLERVHLVGELETLAVERGIDRAGRIVKPGEMPAERMPLEIASDHLTVFLPVVRTVGRSVAAGQPFARGDKINKTLAQAVVGHFVAEQRARRAAHHHRVELSQRLRLEHEPVIGDHRLPGAGLVAHQLYRPTAKRNGTVEKPSGGSVAKHLARPDRRCGGEGRHGLQHLRYIGGLGQTQSAGHWTERQRVADRLGLLARHNTQFDRGILPFRVRQVDDRRAGRLESDVQKTDDRFRDALLFFRAGAIVLDHLVNRVAVLERYPQRLARYGGIGDIGDCVGHGRAAPGEVSPVDDRPALGGGRDECGLGFGLLNLRRLSGPGNRRKSKHSRHQQHPVSHRGSPVGVCGCYRCWSRPLPLTRVADALHTGGARGNKVPQHERHTSKTHRERNHSAGD